MKTFAVSLASLAAAFLAVSLPRTAHALGPVDLEIGARAGYGLSPSSDFLANPYGVGLGGRAGVSIIGIYAGVSGMYYLGESSSVLGGSVSAHTAMEGLEAGFTLPIPFVKIRPYVGVGNSTISSSVSGVAGSAGLSLGGSTSNLYLEPGVLVMIPLGTFFVGADATALILPSVTTGPSSSKLYAAPTFHGQFGVKF
jgi:hypothetical protein